MTIIVVILVLGGILGSNWGPNWLAGLSFMGLFGPYILRESGVIPWRDDYQRETMMSAGMHALIVTGITSSQRSWAIPWVSMESGQDTLNWPGSVSWPSRHADGLDSPAWP